MKVNILLVDDQPARLLSYETILQSLDQNLICASSGAEALEWLLKEEFAVVLLDVNMPGIDGFETAKLIHQHPRFERTPIIFVTGVHQSELDTLRGYEHGAVDYVYVPVSPVILRSKVAVLVELHCQRLQLQRLNSNFADANARLELSNAQLQAERALTLERLNTELKRANDDLQASNHNLQAEVTVRQRAEAALIEANRQKDQFIAILAHELRNPLAPIRNAIEIIRLKGLSDPQFVWARDVVARQLAQLTRLVDDLLDVSRISRGLIALTRTPEPIASIVAEAVETAQPLIQQHRHELSVQMPDEALTLDCDHARLVQALGNLLSNAAKYTQPGGRITLKVERDGSNLAIHVRDTGIGLAPDLIPRLFNLFVQADGAMDRVNGGLGIGLALVRQLVELHGGTVSASSPGIQQGSEFVIRLPLLSADAPATINAEPVLPTIERGRGKSKCILLADDNKDALESLAVLLKLEGYDVRTAADGQEALAIARECKPAVALLDLGMPKCDGYEVARSIRAEPWGKSTRLIALTGWGQEADRRRTRESGFDRHCVKPVDIDALLSALKGVAPGEDGDDCLQAQKTPYVRAN